VLRGNDVRCGIGRNERGEFSRLQLAECCDQ
jgi:hypothetical protein